MTPRELVDRPSRVARTNWIARRDVRRVETQGPVFWLGTVARGERVIPRIGSAFPPVFKPAVTDPRPHKRPSQRRVRGGF
jgi:hypothetical protein